MGFPSPADDFLMQELDLNKKFVLRPNSTFFMWLGGNGMKDSGICKGDLLIIDRSLKPANNDVAVCVIDGEFVLKRLFVQKGIVLLLANDSDGHPLELSGDNSIWGVVVSVVKRMRDV